MNKISLIKLFIAAVILSLISLSYFFIVPSFRNSQSYMLGNKLIARLPTLNIETISITSPSDKTIILNRGKDGEWSVANLFNYPADNQKINDLLETLSDIKLYNALSLIKII